MTENIKGKVVVITGASSGLGEATARLLSSEGATVVLAARRADRIEALAEDPRPPGCKKLSGSERYRIRQGPYRIVYAIEDNQLIVYVVKIGDRKSVYRSSR